LPFTVYVTRPIPAEGIELLRQSIQTVVVREEEDPPTKEVSSRIGSTRR